MMKWLIVALSVLFIVLQYKLWFAPGGYLQMRQLKDQVSLQREINDQQLTENQILAAQVADLKHGQEAVEEQARLELGMTKQDEVFYQIVN